MQKNVDTNKTNEPFLSIHGVRVALGISFRKIFLLNKKGTGPKFYRGSNGQYKYYLKDLYKYEKKQKEFYDSHLSESELAERWGCNVQKVIRKRHNKMSPPFIVVHRKIYYPLEKVIEYEKKKNTNYISASRAMKELNINFAILKKWIEKGLIKNVYYIGDNENEYVDGTKRSRCFLRSEIDKILEKKGKFRGPDYISLKDLAYDLGMKVENFRHMVVKNNSNYKNKKITYKTFLNVRYFHKKQIPFIKKVLKNRIENAKRNGWHSRKS